MSDQAIPEVRDDILTPNAVSMLRQAGPTAYRRLVLDSASTSESRQELARSTASALFIRPVSDREGAEATLAAIWLWHDALDECHRIVQDLVGPTGSFWHAIMHRREGDFSNAKYWYRRCESHHVIKMMGAVASSLAGELVKDHHVAHALGDGWNPIGFVDLVQAVHNKANDPRHELAVRLQIAEWEGLFNYSMHEATVGSSSNLDSWDKRVIDTSQ